MSNDKNETQSGFFKGMINDQGLQQAAATLVVAALVAGAKKLIFRA
jgi:hypothetical protein